MCDAATETAKTRDLIEKYQELVASGEHILSMIPMELVSNDDGEMVIDLPFDMLLAGPRGHLQGGVIATLADMVGGRLAMQNVSDNQIVVTTDLTVHYLSGIRSGVARAIGKVLRAGSSTRTIRVDIYDGVDGELAAACTLAFRVVTSG